MQTLVPFAAFDPPRSPTSLSLSSSHVKIHYNKKERESEWDHSKKMNEYKHLYFLPTNIPEINSQDENEKFPLLKKHRHKPDFFLLKLCFFCPALVDLLEKDQGNVR